MLKSCKCGYLMIVVTSIETMLQGMENTHAET